MTQRGAGFAEVRRRLAALEMEALFVASAYAPAPLTPHGKVPPPRPPPGTMRILAVVRDKRTRRVKLLKLKPKVPGASPLAQHLQSTWGPTLDPLDAAPRWRETEISPTLVVTREVPCTHLVSTALMAGANSPWFTISYASRPVAGSGAPPHDAQRLVLYCATRDEAVELVDALESQRAVAAPPAPSRALPDVLQRAASDWPTGTTPLVAPEEDTNDDVAFGGPPAWLDGGAASASAPSTFIAHAASASDGDSEFRRLDSLAYDLLLTAERLQDLDESTSSAAEAFGKLRVGCERLSRGVDETLASGGASTPGDERSIELWLKAVDVINETLSSEPPASEPPASSRYAEPPPSSAALAREAAAAAAEADAAAAAEAAASPVPAPPPPPPACAPAPPAASAECGLCFESFASSGALRRAAFFPCLHAKQCLGCASSVFRATATCPWCAAALAPAPQPLWE